MSSSNALEGDANVETPPEGKPGFRVLPSPIASLIYVVLGFGLGFAYSQFDWDTLDSSASLANFTAKRPFQYRILLPAITHFLAPLLHISSRHFFEVADILFAILLPFAFRLLLGNFMEDRFATPLALLILYAVYTGNCLLFNAFYVYDFPAILFFTLGLQFILKKQWPAFYLTLALASLNRETSVFLCIALVLVWFGRMRPIDLAAHFAASAGIWAAIHLALVHIFRHNPGHAVEMSLSYNYHMFRHILHGDIKDVIKCAGLAGGLWILTPMYRHAMPPDLRRLAWIAIPIVAGMTVVGHLEEVRIYGELTVVICAIAACAIVEGYRVHGGRLPKGAIPVGVGCLAIALAGATVASRAFGDTHFRTSAIKSGAAFLSDAQSGAYADAVSMMTPPAIAAGLPAHLPEIGRAFQQSSQLKPASSLRVSDGQLTVTLTYRTNIPRPATLTLDFVSSGDRDQIEGYKIENQ